MNNWAGAIEREFGLHLKEATLYDYNLIKQLPLKPFVMLVGNTQEAKEEVTKIILDNLLKMEKESTDPLVYWSVIPEETTPYPSLVGHFFLARTLGGAYLQMEKYSLSKSIPLPSEKIGDLLEYEIASRGSYKALLRLKEIKSLLLRDDTNNLIPKLDEMIQSALEYSLYGRDIDLTEKFVEFHDELEDYRIISYPKVMVHQ